MKPTVLILGAGASAPFKFPIGDGLSARIISALKDRSSQVSRMFELRHIPRQEVELVAASFNDSHAMIDEYIQTHQHLEPYAKLAIAEVLSLCEQQSVNEIRNDPNWYKTLFRRLNTDEGFFDGKLSIITFNYDRSLEYFLRNTLCNLRNIDDKNAKAIVGNLHIHHFYGSLGPLDHLIEYGSHNDGKVTKAMDHIHLITRDGTDNDDREKALQRCVDAEVIAFCGFGFHKLNLEKLKVDRWQNNKAIHATCFDLDGLFRNQIENIFHRPGGINWITGKADVLLSYADLFAP